MKLPFMKFFPRDWQADTNLRMCSLEARGLWFEMLCIMAQSTRYGYLVNGDGKTPIADDSLTRLIGCSKDDLYRARSELLEHGVPSLELETNAWFNRRMVREDHKRGLCAEAGKSGGGNPALKKHSRTPDDQNPDSRSHIRLKATNKGDVYTCDFERFWGAYPRKVAKKKAFKAWNGAKDKPDVQAIIKAVETHKASEQWRKDGGQFIPHPATWLNAGQWEDVVTIAKQSKSADAWRMAPADPIPDDPDLPWNGAKP